MNAAEFNVAQRVRIDYADQNEAFAPLLPRTGQLIHACEDIHGNSGWFLLRLDDPLEYQVKVGRPFRFRLVRADQFLIRSRWEHRLIGAEEPTSVFILLVGQGEQVPVPFDPASYIHVAWGTCTTVA